MPTYEYRCPAGHSFEKFYPTMNDSRRVKCPTCGKRAERQISGGAGLVFKGSGFYITDYKRAGEKKPDQKDDAKPAAETKPATETKPADSGKKNKDSGDK
jgi:putative FmdB family regulatory protein